MKPEHQNLNPTELALLTWYGGNDLEHIIIKLAGEIGELLDLYGKHKYKPGFSWLQCKVCGHIHKGEVYCLETYKWEEDDISKTCYCQNNTPKVLDEMGDIWFYLRILVWNENSYLDENLKLELEKIDLDKKWFMTLDFETELDAIKRMYEQASKLLNQKGTWSSTETIYIYLNWLLKKLGYGIEDLTRLNYIKLNSEDSHHGWKVKN